MPSEEIALKEIYVELLKIQKQLEELNLEDSSYFIDMGLYQITNTLNIDPTNQTAS